MPRRHRSARERSGPPPPAEPRGSEAPFWALIPGYEVRSVFGDKVYRCPGCDHPVRRGVQHLVAVPQDAPDERRHWHLECWRRELRRLGRQS
jgi:hypothetical protein